MGAGYVTDVEEVSGGLSLVYRESPFTVFGSEGGNIPRRTIGVGTRAGLSDIIQLFRGAFRGVSHPK